MPNNPPRAPASHHATVTNAIKLDTRINGSSVLTETKTPVDEGTGWGVSARDFALQQPAEETLSEQDELEEPQHDPEDDFTWQAVKEMLKTAPASSGQAAHSNTVMNPPLTSNGDEGMVFGVEIIPEPQSAPRGAPDSPSQHTCAPPSGSASQNALLDSNGSANSGVAADVVDITARVETASVSDVGTADMDIASNSSSIASATGPSGQTENVLFRPITPPPALEAKEESTTPTIHDNRKREGTQDIPEPELPAEDPWDLIPEPGFEPFLTRDAFVRSGAPSLESRLTSRNSSPIPEPQAEPLFKPADLAEGVDEADKPALDGKASPEAVVGAVDNAQDASSDKATKASKRLERKTERHAKSKEKKKARLKGWRGMRKQQKKEKLAQIRQEESVQEAEAEAEASKSRQERSPSVECLNPIRPVPSRRQAALETGVTSEPRQNYTDDEDDGMLLKDMPSSQVNITAPISGLCCR